MQERPQVESAPLPALCVFAFKGSSPPVPVAWLDALSLRVRQSGSLPGPNEDLDEVRSEDLPLLMVDWWLARALLGDQAAGSEARRANVVRARDVMGGFLERCRRLGLAATEGGEAGAPAPSTRETRIARFKAQKAVRDAVAVLEKEARGRFGEDVEEGLRGDQWDEVRDLWVMRIKLACEEALDEMDSAAKELEVLEFMIKADPKELQKTRDERVRQQQAPGSADITRLSKTLEVKREVLKDGVFRPYHNLPTMSLEEYAEREMAQLREREARQAQALATNPPVLSLNEVAEQGREDDTDVVDRATDKARKWDDWKDGVPKGAGVTKRI